MATSMRRTAEIVVGLPRDRTIALFTPEGERRWAAGWDPHYPAARRCEGSGAVFTTEHGGRHATWVIVDQTAQSIRYARVVHGMTAGTVAVEVLDSTDDGTRVRVTYDLTALSPAGEDWLEAFEAGYQTEIANWATEIAAALHRSAPPEHQPREG